MNYKVYYRNKLDLPNFTMPTFNINHYVKVAEVEAENEEEVFHKMNMDVPYLLNIRSMCSGDFVIDEFGNGKFCLSIGWVDFNP